MGGEKRNCPIAIRKGAFESFFYAINAQQNKFLGLFVEKQSPVFTTFFRQFDDGDLKRGDKLIWNGCLKNWEFFRVKDPYTAFMEIAMFLGGIAVPQKPIPVPPDKDMVEIKGFDKHSFRKDPSSKRRKS